MEITTQLYITIALTLVILEVAWHLLIHKTAFAVPVSKTQREKTATIVTVKVVTMAASFTAALFMVYFWKQALMATLALALLIPLIKINLNAYRKEESKYLKQPRTRKK